MKSHISYLALFVILFCTFNSFAAQYRFTHLSIDDGLSHNDITAIAQDKNGFMWFATRDGLNRYDGKKIKTYKHSTNDPALFDVNFIKSLSIDQDGILWIGSKGISYYKPENDSLVYFDKKTKDGEYPENSIISIQVDSRGWVYFLEKDKGVYCYKTNTEELVFYPFLKKLSITAMWIGKDNKIWLGVDQGNLIYLEHENRIFHEIKIEGLNLPCDQLQCITGTAHFLYLGFQYSGVIRYDFENNSFSPIILEQAAETGIFVHDILIDNHMLWIGTERGLYIHDEISKQNNHITQDYFDIYSLSDNAIYKLFKDRDNGFWLGTYFGGANYLSLSQSKFVEVYYPLVGKYSLNGKVIREICQDEKERLWIGTEDAGLNCFDPKTKKAEYFSVLNRPSYQNTHGLAIVENKLFIGNFAKGLSILDLKNFELSHHYISEDKYNVQNSIYSICYDSQKRIWIGTRNGVYLYSIETKSFERLDILGDIFAHNIYEDSKGNIWISTLGQSAICYKPNNNITKYNEVFIDELGNSIDKVLNTFEDSKGRIWFATSNNGVIVFDPSKNSYIKYDINSGLPDNVAYKIVEDFFGNIWFGTNKGLVCMNTEKQKIQVFTKNDGLPGNQFNYNSAFCDQKGKLYFGTIAGLIVIDPAAIPEDTSFPPVLFTGLQIHNKEVKIGDNSPLKQSITYTKNIVLSHKQNSIGFDIAVLRYSASQKNSCWVKLDGLEDKWTYLGNDLRVSYSNLLPGKYTLRVKSSNSLGNWSETNSIEIKILPPWWKTSAMYMAYILLLLVILVSMYLLIVKRIEKRQNAVVQKMQRDQERETYRAKIDFFTSIAHEIKNPLSLIKAPLEYILKNKQFDSETKESLDTIMKNTDRLLSLAYQLLDFRRIENDRIALKIENSNIRDIIMLTYDRFKIVAEQQQIDFSISFCKDILEAEIDVENFTKIISNLFNNALKYTESYIRCELKIFDKSKFQIIVENDGNLIDPAMNEKIFEPFIQLVAKDSLNTGRGLGLFLARSLTEMHGGTLIYDLSHIDCNRFILTLPFIHVGLLENKKEDLEIEHGNNVKKNILLVEDNLEILDFMSKKLIKTYNVLKATNGLEAIKQLKDNDIDVIVSDIMMPKMDGFELLEIIKSQIDYSHIPVILLTAKTNLQSKIDGLELGADAYIEKPFSLEFVLAQIQNLLKNRQAIKESFTKRPLTKAKIVALTKSDELFLQKMNSIIEENISNMQFGVDLLSEKLNMSSSSLYRKIKGLSDLSPNDYIRLQRLKSAAILLEEGNSRINEIASITGFASASYFSKCFQQYFDMLPKDFAKMYKKHHN